MNKKIFTLFLTSVIVLTTTAQVSFSLQVPPVGVVQKSQLWNMALIYTGNSPMSVYVSLSLLNANDNRPVMGAETAVITLTRGAKQVNATDLGPIQYNYLSPSFNADRNPDGFLPFGIYKACYTVYKKDHEMIVPLAEDCIPVEVQPLSPPLLNSPDDASSIETPYPQFTWLPAVPLNLFTDLNYDLLLVEVLPGQTKGDAIQKNLPVYNINYCKTPFNNYPGSNKSLDTGRTYAWKVVAKNQDDFVDQSEIWTFTVHGNNSVKTIPLTGSYGVLQDDLKGVYSVRNDTLHVKYYSFDKIHTGTILFTDESGQVTDQDYQLFAQGDNYLDFIISSRFQTGKNYLISITSLDGKKHVLRFNISKKQ